MAIFWTTLQAHSDSVCVSWDKNGPIPEVTGFLGFHGMGEELREGDRRVSTGLRVGGRSASGDTRRDEPEFGMGRVTRISLPE